MGTREGAMKAVARRLGVSVAEVTRRREAGEKWCTRCKEWHPTSAFVRDVRRYDGLTASCAQSRNRHGRATYVRREQQPRGRRYAQARSGDASQAHARVNYLVSAGLIPAPNDLPCTDCGHIAAPSERHEYDHHKGYDAAHHEDVEAVCVPCHRRRHGR